MSETIGFNITANVDGVVKGVSLASGSLKQFANSAKSTQSQIEALSKASAQMSQYFAKSMALPKVTGVAEAQKAMAEFTTSGIINRMNAARKAVEDANRALREQNKVVVDVAAGWKKLGDMGAKQWDGIQIANKMASASTSLLIEKQKALAVQLTKVEDGWKRLGQMGARQWEGTQMANKMASASTSLVIEKQKALEVQLAKNAAGWQKLGEMGKRQWDGTQMTKKMAEFAKEAELARAKMAALKAETQTVTAESVKLAAQWKALGDLGSDQLKNGNLFASSLTAGMSAAGKAAEVAKAKIDALANTTRIASATVDEATRKVQALYAAGKDVTGRSEGFKGLGAALGMQTKPVVEAQKANQTFFDKMRGWFAETTMGQKRMASETEKSAKRMVAANEKVGMSIRGWLPHIRTGAASLGIFFGVRAVANIIKVADTFTEMGARLRLVSGNTQELARAQEGLFKIAQSNRAPLTDVVNLYFKLGNSMRDLGVSQKDVLQTVDTVGKAMRVSGASTIEISAAMQQLSQAFAKGKLDGDEFRSTMENAPRLMKALTDEFQISKDELYKWSETGRLSVEKLVQAIKNQSGAIEQEFKTIPVTISGAWQQVSNAMAKYVADADSATESSKGLAWALSKIAQHLEIIMDAVIWPVKAVEGWQQMASYARQISISLQNISNSNAVEKLSEVDKNRVYDMYGVNRAIDPSRRIDAGATALTTARSYLGYSETGQKQELIDYLNKYSGTVFKDVAGDVNAWCARFVSAVLQQNGIQNPQTASARAFAQFGQSVWKKGDGNQGMENVKPGDIVVFTRGKGGHVAFVESVDMQKRTMDVLGGNQGNAVSIRRRSFDDPNLMAIRRAVGGGDFFNGKNATVEKLATTLSQLTDLQKMIVQKSIAAGMDPYLMLGLAQRESRFNPNAVADPSLVRGRGPGKTGMGLYQFIPSTGEKYGLMNDADRKNAEKATDAAIAHLKDLLNAFSGDMTKALAAWNMGEPNLRRHLANNEDPQKFTEGPHVQRILEYRKQWESRLRGAMPNIMDTGDLEKQNKAFDKVLDDQYEAFAKHLKRLEDERSAYNTVDLAEQRTQMEKLEAQREQMRRADEAAIANAQGSGNMGAVRQATAAAAEHEIKFLKEKNKLLLDGMDIEYKAMAARKGHVQQMIADAQRNKGPAALAALPDLRSEQKQLDAQMRALAEQRKQIEVKAAAEISEATIKAEDDKRKAYRDTADVAVESQRQRLEGLQAEFAVQKELANISSEAFSQYADQQRGAIDLSLERAKAEFENRDAQRQAMLEGKEGLDAIIQARENLNARLQDQLALLAQERDATVQKLDLTRQELEYQKRLAEWQLQRTQAIEPNDELAKLAAKKQIADLEAQITKNLNEQKQATERLNQERAKAQGDYARQSIGIDKKEIQAVSDAVLEMNKMWDNAVDAIRDYSKTFVAAFGEVGNTLARISDVMAEYERRQDRINQKAEEAIKSNPGKRQEIEQRKYYESVANTADLMANTMLTARTFYKEGSSGYRAMTQAAQAFALVTQVVNIGLGIQAVLKQLTEGDVYSAIFRGIAVAAMVGSLGIAIAGIAGGSGGGGQTRESAEDRRKKQLSGTVLGNDEAFSDSLVNSLNIVAENSSADLDYSRGMLRALTNIEKLLGGASAAVAGGLMNMPNLFKLGKGWEFSDIGLSSVDKTLGQYFSGGGFQGAAWGEIVKEAADGTKRYKDIFTELNGTIKSQFTRVILGIADSVRKAGEAFGLSASDFHAKMMGFVVSFGNVSFGDLKGDDLEKAVQQMFSKMSDQMAQAFMPGLNAFQQVGEGYFETMVRVSNGILVATGMLEQAGLTAINYQDIILKQGDVAAEIVRQSIVAFEGVSSAIGAYVDQAVGSAEELMAVYQDLLIVSDTAKIAGFNMNNLSNALIVTSGGVNKFLENLSTYTTEILGGSDYARQMLTLTREFQKLGQAVPANNEAFVMLVDSIDTTTEAGQKLYAQILALAGAFSKAQQEAKRLEELRNKYLPADSMAGYRQQIEQVKKDFKEIIDGTIAAMPGGPTYIRRTRRVEVLGNRRNDRQDDLDIINEDIAELEAKGKLTQKEKQRLATLRQQRKVLNEEIKAIDDQIKAIEKLIANNPKSQKLIEERAKLLEEQGDAIIKTLSDIWDAMTQAITAARETLKSINDSIFELIGGTGSENMKLGMATARRVIAEGDYTRYTQNGGTDIVQLQKYADAYYRAIMDERDAKIAAIEAPMKALEKEREIKQKAHDAEIAALEKQLGVAKELFDAVRGIQEYAKSLRTATSANLSPKKQLDATRAVYDELLAKAKTGDVEAMRQITGASDEYLEAARKYFGSGGKYGQIFDGIVSAMDSLGMTDAGDAQSIQDKIDQLNEAHGKYLDSIDRQIAALNIEEQIKAENDKTAQRLKDLAKDLGPRIEQAEAQAKKDMADLITEVRKTNEFSSAQLDALNQLLTAWGMDPIAGPAPANPTEPTLPAPTDDWVQRLFERWNQGQTGYKPPLPAFAQGGLAQPGWALVGEEGPELVKFGSQAMVYDAEATARMLREIASFQPVMPEAPRPINLAPMPRVVDDLPKQGKPIKMAPMPRVIDDIPRRDPDVNWLSNDKVIAELRAMRTELKALVTTQSRANPAVIEQLANIERRLGYMERDQKLKPA